MKIRNILCVFAPMLLVSLCTGICPEPVAVRFNYSRVVTFAPETAFAGEVSLRIRLTDTIRASNHFLYWSGHLGIPKVYGHSWIDPFFYEPNQSITGVQIITLHDISPAIPALSDVSNSFYALPNQGFLFITIDEFIRYHGVGRVEFSEGIPYNEFQIYLRERIENQFARFVVTVSLSDGRTLSDTTSTIIVTSN